MLKSKYNLLWGGNFMKKLLSLALALTLCLCLAVPANAASTGQVGQPSTISASSLAYISRDGRLMMWEGDSYAIKPGENTPTPDMFAEVMRDVASFARMGHYAVLKTDGSLWSWGENNRGEVGIGLVPDPQTGKGNRVNNSRDRAFNNNHASGGGGTVDVGGQPPGSAGQRHSDRFRCPY